MKTLIIIPARGGSKGIPYKNIKELAGKPLIDYTIDVARQVTSDENICVTTDDEKIIQVVNKSGLEVPFVRPEYLASDTAGTNDVLLHALEFYEQKDLSYDCIILLQVTSPFRKSAHIMEALKLYDNTVDMVASVMHAKCNPYYDGYEDDDEGLLSICKGTGTISRRQDAPKVWQLNGSIYIINPQSLKEKGLDHFTRIRKYPMDDIYSIDIDNMMDWNVAELILKENMVDL